MFLGQQLPPGSFGEQAEFSFVVYRDGHIEDIKIKADYPELGDFVQSRIESLEGTEVLDFIPSTQRNQVPYESSIMICLPGSPGCNEPATPDQYPDTESYTQPQP